MSALKSSLKIILDNRTASLVESSLDAARTDTAPGHSQIQVRREKGARGADC